MPLDRRSFLIGAGAAAVACKADGDGETDDVAVPAPLRDPSPAPYDAPGTEDLVMFPWSLGVGDPTPDGCVLTVRANAPAVEVVLAWNVDGTWQEAGRLPNRETDGETQWVEVSGLEPDTPYAVWAELDGARSIVTHFRTAPAPDTTRQVRLVATSCLGNAGNGLANLEFVPDQDADAILLLGDTTYADGSITREDYWAHWDAHNQKPRVRDLFRAGAVVATWDDHEVANNWVLGGETGTLNTAVSQEQLDIATEVWRAVVPMRLGPGGSQVWRRLQLGTTAELFVLDCRGERGEGRIVSNLQLEWLVDALAESTATFKLVLASVHVTDHFDLIGVIQDADRWQGYPEQRATLIAAAAEVPGTVFITGDMHYGAVQRLDPEGGPGAGLYEIAAGPAGSTLFPVSDLAAIGGGTVPDQYETLVETYSFCVIDLDPGLGTVSVQFVDDAGEVVAEHVLAGL